MAASSALSVIDRATAPIRRLFSRSVRNLTTPSGGFDPLHPWLLTAVERGNEHTALRPWTVGNTVVALPHGRTYFARLAEVLATVSEGDSVYFANWRGDPEQVLNDTGDTVIEAFAQAAERGATVRGLIWRSHWETIGFTAPKNRELAERVNGAGGEVVLDQRVLALGSHHQKFVVVNYADPTRADVAFLGGIDLARSRRDGADHQGDPISRPFPAEYGNRPPWHDVQIELSGPAVRDTETVFRERWDDPAALSRLPWHAVPDIVRPRVKWVPGELPPFPADPPASGTCTVQLLRTYPRRTPSYPFAPSGERSIAHAYAKALHRARRLIYIEDQYLWSVDVARVFADALRRSPDLLMVIVVPRVLDDDSPITIPSALLGHGEALRLLQEAGPGRVTVLDLENHDSVPVYVHAKVCVIDDVWVSVGSDNFNRRSWTHDSELTAAILDEERDTRHPADPGGHGDGARRFARDLRLQLACEHLDRDPDDIGDLLDPGHFFTTMIASARDLDAWHASGELGRRPAGRLRSHEVTATPRWKRTLATPIYRVVVDPDGRPFRMRLTRKF